MLKPLSLAGALCCLLVAGAPALAQYPEIRAGEPVGGTLSDGDIKLSDGAYADGYIYNGRRGERVTISLQSTDFDAYLLVARISEEILAEGAASDDDSGGGGDALLELTLEHDGAYAIMAGAYAEGETGAYRLSVTSGGEATQTEAIPFGMTLGMGESVSGTIDVNDPILSDGTHYDYHSFYGRAGQQVEITLRSSDFDAYMAVGRMVSGVFSVIDSNDDSGGGTDSRVRMTLPADGEYLVRANTLSEGETGAYTLLLSEAANAAPAPRAIARGERIRAELTTQDPQLADDSYYHDYTYAGVAGERLTIDLASEAFDAYLMIGRRVNGVFSPLESNDDGDESLDSRLEFTLPESGEYVIRANSMDGEATGGYTLHVRSSR